MSYRVNKENLTTMLKIILPSLARAVASSRRLVPHGILRWVSSRVLDARPQTAVHCSQKCSVHESGNIAMCSIYLSHGLSTERPTDAHVYDDCYLSSVRPSVRLSHCGTRQTLSVRVSMLHGWRGEPPAKQSVRLRRKELRLCAAKRADATFAAHTASGGVARNSPWRTGELVRRKPTARKGFFCDGQWAPSTQSTESQEHCRLFSSPMVFGRSPDRPQMHFGRIKSAENDASSGWLQMSFSFRKKTSLHILAKDTVWSRHPIAAKAYTNLPTPLTVSSVGRSLPEVENSNALVQLPAYGDRTHLSTLLSATSLNINAVPCKASLL